MRKKDNMNNQEKRHLKIVYKDAQDKIQEVIILLPEDSFMAGLSYKENIDICVNDIMEGGGFWLNTTTVIPSHKIQSFHMHQPAVAAPQEKLKTKIDNKTETETNIKAKAKTKANRHRRGKRGKKINSENTSSTDNKIS